MTMSSLIYFLLAVLLFALMVAVVLVILLFGARSKPDMPVMGKTVVERNSPIVGTNDTLSQSLGIETIGGLFTVILEKDCSVPCSKSELFSTASDDQESIDTLLYRGTNPIAKDNQFLGRFRIHGFNLAPRGEPQVEVLFEVADNTIYIFPKDISRIKIVRVE